MISDIDRDADGRPATNRQDELRAELARSIALFIGKAERLGTEIPGLMLFRYTAPSSPRPVSYEPSIALIVQGRKQVQLGNNVFVYDASRFLLTSLDLPVISQVIEASEAAPYLCLRLKLEMTAVREFLAREELHLGAAPPDTPAMATAETTADFFAAFCRLLDLMNTPQDIPFLSPLIQREIIYRILRSRKAEGCERSPRWETRASAPPR